MPVIVHAGHPRQGKSYSAVAHQIIPQLAAGRRVVTNIEGMGSADRQKLLWSLVDAVAKGGKKHPRENFVFVPHSKLENALIFPVDMKTETEDGIRIFSDDKSLLKKGDMLVWDEARLFKTSASMPQIWADALDYHGHWTKNGFNTDLVLLTPHWDNLAPTVRGSAEVVYTFDKHPDGQACTRYFYKTPGRDAKLTAQGANDRETVKFDFEGPGSCYATNDDPSVAANDTIVIPLWKRGHFRKKVGIALAVILAGLVAVYMVFSSYLGGDDKPEASPSPAAANRPGGQAAGGFASFGGTVMDMTPTVVGTVPSAGGGMTAIVKIGDRYEHVRVEANTIRYKGEALQWPDAF